MIKVICVGKLKEKYLGMVYNKDNKSLVTKNFIKYIKDSIK